MSQLYVLVVSGKGRQQTEVFYFDSHPQYLRARGDAVAAGRFAGSREVRITDLEEFRNWISRT